MANPRIFISSTFYDLRHVRADIERFIKEMGYEPILNERAQIPYGKDFALEEYCYKEIDRCDILVSIIGGRFGSDSDHKPYSIAQMELKHALEVRKQVYIFVDRNVLSEYSTYLANKDNEKIRFRNVDDVSVYRFLEEIHSLPHNNPIAHFETSQDIISYLRTQWAGIFQRLLQEDAQKEEINVVKEIRTAAETLNKLVSFLTEERKGKDDAIQTILLSTHPAFNEVKKLLNIKYRVYFINLDELSMLLKARTFKPVDEIEWDDPNYQEWISNKENTQNLFKVAKSIFDDDGKLKVMTKDDWNDDLIKLEIS